MAGTFSNPKGQSMQEVIGGKSLRIRIVARKRDQVLFQIVHQDPELRRGEFSTKIRETGWWFKSSANPELDLGQETTLYLWGRGYSKDNLVCICPLNAFENLVKSILALNSDRDVPNVEKEFFTRT